MKNVMIWDNLHRVTMKAEFIKKINLQLAIKQKKRENKFGKKLTENLFDQKLIKNRFCQKKIRYEIDCAKNFRKQSFCQNIYANLILP